MCVSYRVYGAFACVAEGRNKCRPWWCARGGGPSGLAGQHGTRHMQEEVPFWRVQRL